jgi:hypothetical protein
MIQETEKLIATGQEAPPPEEVPFSPPLLKPTGSFVLIGFPGNKEEALALRDLAGISVGHFLAVTEPGEGVEKSALELMEKEAWPGGIVIVQIVI